MLSAASRERPVSSFREAAGKVFAARRAERDAAHAALPHRVLLAPGRRISLISKHGLALGSSDASRVSAIETDAPVAATCFTLVAIEGDASVFGLRLVEGGARFLSVAAERASDRTGVACSFTGKPSGLQAWRIVPDTRSGTVTIVSRVTGQLLCAAPQGGVWLSGADEGDVATLLGWTCFTMVDRGTEASRDMSTLAAPFARSLPLDADADQLRRSAAQNTYPSTPGGPELPFRGTPLPGAATPGASPLNPALPHRATPAARRVQRGSGKRT